MSADRRIAVVIPCFRVSRHVLGVLSEIGPEVDLIFCVDDACPEKSGELVLKESKDPRVRVISHEENRGVGGAMVSGYRAALAAGAEVIVKVDGDGQMNPALIPRFIAPVLDFRADYVKGNRFYNLVTIMQMPKIRLFGNSVLSFLTKLSSGYWDIFDPTNGYTAIHAKVLRELPLSKLSERYFFESDILFRLGTVRASVMDLPMMVKYGDESSSLRVSRVLFLFLKGHFVNTLKRLFYNYFLRDFSIASVQLLLGTGLLSFGLIFGIKKWLYYGHQHVPAPTGTVIVAALTTLIGIQFLLGFLAFDMRPSAKEAISRRLP